MSAELNIKTMQGLYEAFAVGDLDTILDGVTDDCDWQAAHEGTAIPWYGNRRGKAGAASFFQDLGSNVQIERFEPITFTGNEDGDVIVVINWACHWIASGKKTEGLLMHYWRFENGKIAYFRGMEDSAQSVRAFS